VLKLDLLRPKSNFGHWRKGKSILRKKETWFGKRLRRCGVPRSEETWRQLRQPCGVPRSEETS
jgi:hypothetical protein